MMVKLYSINSKMRTYIHILGMQSRVIMIIGASKMYHGIIYIKMLIFRKPINSYFHFKVTRSAQLAD